MGAVAGASAVAADEQLSAGPQAVANRLDRADQVRFEGTQVLEGIKRLID